MAIRVAVAGVGPRGRDWVRELRASNAFDLVACIDPDERSVKQTVEYLKIPQTRCFSDFDRALKETGAQAVVVATPADCHFQTCHTALARNLPVLVEKPFTTSLSTAYKLVALAESKNLPLVVAQNYRYLRSFRTVRVLLQEGRLGRIGQITCQYYRVPHEMSPSLQRSPHSVLWGMGVHHLDALRFVLGDEAIEVLSDDFTLPWNQPLRSASIRLMLSFAKGARVTYSATYESSGHEFFEGGQEFYARFVGERATLHVFQRWLILCEKGKLPRLIKRGPRKVTEEQHLLEQFERAILQREIPESSGRDNLQTMALIEACIRSAVERQWINPQELINELF